MKADDRHGRSKRHAWRKPCLLTVKLLREKEFRQTATGFRVDTSGAYKRMQSRSSDMERGAGRCGVELNGFRNAAECWIHEVPST
jgi:hypothetical protein